MKNILFYLFLMISSSVFSQQIKQDTLINNFTYNSYNAPLVMTINYWVYMSGKPYYYYAPRNLNPTIKLGINNKKMYICNDNYFYYTQGRKKYKFIF